MRLLMLLKPNKKPIVSRFFIGPLPRLINPLYFVIFISLSKSLMAEEMTLNQSIVLNLKGHPTFVLYQYRLNIAKAYAQYISTAVEFYRFIDKSLHDPKLFNEKAHIDQGTIDKNYILRTL